MPKCDYNAMNVVHEALLVTSNHRVMEVHDVCTWDVDALNKEQFLEVDQTNVHVLFSMTSHHSISNVAILYHS